MSIIKNLPTYVEQNHDKLLRDSIMGAESAKDFTLQTGVKTQTALNLLNTSVVFQDGSVCGFNASGTSTISQRTITAGVIKVQNAFCHKTLLNSCLQHQVRIAAGQKTLPFEADFVADIIANINLGVEKLVWQGDTTSNDASLKWTDGLIKILTANDGITVASQKLEHDAIVKANVCAAVDNVVLAIPTPVLNMSTIYMGYDTFRLWRMALQAANLFHESGDGLDRPRAFYPGTNIEVKPVAGLDGTGVIVSGPKRNFYYGVGDMDNESSVFDLWYSKDNDEFRFNCEFAVGTQTAFPNQCVISQVGE